MPEDVKVGPELMIRSDRCRDQAESDVSLDLDRPLCRGFSLNKKINRYNYEDGDLRLRARGWYNDFEAAPFFGECSDRYKN